MATHYRDDYAEDAAYAEDDTEVSDFTALFAAVLFWLGVLCLATPFAGLSIALMPIGGVIWLCRPALRKAESAMSETARNEGLTVRSGCALLWAWLVGIVVITFAALVALAVLGAVMSLGVIQ